MRVSTCVVVAVLGLSSCAGGETTPRATASVAPTATPATPIPVDWARLPDMPPIHAGVWRFDDCGGDAPLLCVERRGARVGRIELLIFERDTFGANADDVDAIAAGNLESFRKDRVTSCPSGHVFRARATVHPAVAGLDGRRTEWTVTGDGRRVVERVVTYFAVDPQRVIVFAANATLDGGCLSRDDAEFTPDVLEQLVPTLDRLVAGSTVPVGTS